MSPWRSRPTGILLGEVTTPGQYPYVVNMTAETAIAIAGGFAPCAFKKTVELTRKSGGQQIRTEVPLDYPVPSRSGRR